MVMSRFDRSRHVLLAGFMLAAAHGFAAESQPAARPAPAKPKEARATFAGGCFWCMEPPYEKLDGVIAVVSGYTGGHKDNPAYEEVSSGTTGHTEAVEVVYDPSRVRYEKLLDVFWHNVDPTVDDRQFCDGGRQYRPGIFYHDDEQRRLAEESKRGIEKGKTFKEPLRVEITALKRFYPAEEYHQDYYKKNPIRYKYYRSRCGRDRRLEELWGDAAGKGLLER